MSSKLSHKAYVIGAGIGNLSAAVYLIRDGEWNGEDITIMDLDMHGANGGESAATVQRQYGHRELGDDAGFINRGGRMLNEETYENLRDGLSVVPSRRERLQAHAIRQQRSIPVGEADELRRCMNRMILEFSRIQTLAGITRSAYNQYESIISPMRTFLEGKGVKFVNELKITEFVFKDTPLRDEIIVTGLDYENVRTGEKGRIDAAEGDFVFDTNDSITDSSSIGDLDTPIAEDMRNPPSALLWKQATEHFHDLGNPDKFVGDRAQSEWTSFTVTTSSHELINEISRITKQLPGNALNMFVDSNVLLSIVVHHQPHYHAQTRDHGQRRQFDSQPHALRLAFIS